MQRAYAKICVIFPLLLLFSVKCQMSFNESVNVDNLREIDPNYGVTWMFFPDGEGNPQIAYLVEPASDGASAGRNFNPFESDQREVKFYLYRRDFKDEPRLLTTENPKSRGGYQLDDQFDPSKKTKFIIHGWKNTYKSDVGQKIKNAYLSKDDMNVIVVDWSKMADDNFYIRSAYSTRFVGRSTAGVVDKMVLERGARLDDIHIIGHSLGAHTAGYAGMYTRSGRISRITGLDPAWPGFGDPDPSGRLDASDAEFVDVIHTCAGMLGHNEPLGVTDIWPNGGGPNQPGCSAVADYFGACSHGRSYEYYADSIEHRPMKAFPCDSYASYSAGMCRENPITIGDDTPRTANGSFYLTTRDSLPFGWD